MARRRSLGERVVWAVTATVALLVGLQSVLAYIAMHAQEDELSESMLQREVQQIAAHILQPGLTPTGTLIDSSRVSAWLTRDGEGSDAMPASNTLFVTTGNNYTVPQSVKDCEAGAILRPRRTSCRTSRSSGMRAAPSTRSASSRAPSRMRS